MNSKGVSPIIAMVLIVLITLSLAGAFLIWTQRTASSLTERGTEQSQRITGQFDKGVRIEATDCSQVAGADTLVIRNSGTTAWKGADLTFFINDALSTSAITFSNNGDVAAGSVVQATFSQGLASGDKIRVAYQDVSDSTICK
ncbi:MAG: hypothetical protein HY366_01195 [Candidatus Aenigmarchaeota archaeon]|nr:hypothetical protein [Candidatus Aenigmarchaeota archaeon]